MAYPTPLVTPTVVLQTTADVLKRSLDDLTTNDPTGRYARQAALYAQQAYLELVLYWGQRGYSASQVDTSDQGTNWNRDLAVWYMLRDEANLPDGVKIQWQAEFDWRLEWKELKAITAGGVPVAGQVPLMSAAYVPFDTSKDRFTECWPWFP